MANTPERTDGFVFEPDGTVTITLEDGKRTLRRPKIGELRRLKERHAATGREAAALRQRAVERTQELQEQAKEVDGDDPDARDHIVGEVHAVTDQLRADAENLWLSLTRFVFDGGDHHGEHVHGLADKPLPDADDDLPGWFMSSDAVTQLVTHWQTAPPPRGAR